MLRVVKIMITEVSKDNVYGVNRAGETFKIDHTPWYNLNKGEFYYGILYSNYKGMELVRIDYGNKKHDNSFYLDFLINKKSMDRDKIKDLSDRCILNLDLLNRHLVKLVENNPKYKYLESDLYNEKIDKYELPILMLKRKSNEKINRR